MLDMDETGVQLEHNPGKILARKGAKHLQSPTSGNRETITIMACISAAGEACAPHIIPKGKTVKTLESLALKILPQLSGVLVRVGGPSKDLLYCGLRKPSYHLSDQKDHRF